jgi:hypothetical protein
VTRILRYGDGFYVRADEKKPIPSEKIQQYIIKYYNKEAIPLGKKAARYIHDYLVELSTAFEFYRKLGPVVAEKPFTVALGDKKFSFLYNERLEPATDNYYLQMSRLSAKSNHRFDKDFKNLTRAQEKAADARSERKLDRATLAHLNETDKEVRAVTESLYQDIIEAIANQIKQSEALKERTDSAPFEMMLTRYNNGRNSWMAGADKFKIGLTALFDEVEDLHAEARRRFEAARNTLRKETKEEKKVATMTTPKTLKYAGHTYRRVEAAQTPEELRERANELRRAYQRLKKVSEREGTGEAVDAIRDLNNNLTMLMKGYNLLFQAESVLPRSIMGTPGHVVKTVERALSELDDLEKALGLFGSNMGRWAADIDRVVSEQKQEGIKRTGPHDDPKTLKAPPQTVIF